MEVLSDFLDAKALHFKRITGGAIESIGRMQFSCPRHGEYMANGTRLKIRDVWSSCPGCEADRKAREDADRAREQALREANTRLYHLQQAAIPQRFIERTLDTFKATTPEQQHAFRVATDFASNFEAHYKKGS